MSRSGLLLYWTEGRDQRLEDKEEEEGKKGNGGGEEERGEKEERSNLRGGRGRWGEGSILPAEDCLLKYQACLLHLSSAPDCCPLASEANGS